MTGDKHGTGGRLRPLDTRFQSVACHILIKHKAPLMLKPIWNRLDVSKGQSSTQQCSTVQKHLHVLYIKVQRLLTVSGLISACRVFHWKNCRTERKIVSILTLESSIVRFTLVIIILLHGKSFLIMSLVEWLQFILNLTMTTNFILSIFLCLTLWLRRH